MTPETWSKIKDFTKSTFGVAVLVAIWVLVVAAST